MLRREQRLGDVLSAHRQRARQLLGASAVGLALAVASAGCGEERGSDDPIIAQPVAPPAVAAAETPTSNPVVPEKQVPASADETPASSAREGNGRGDVLTPADRVRFRRLERSLGGEHGLAVSGLGRDRPVTEMGSLRSGVAWSTSKVPIAMAVIAAGGGEAQQQALTAAITMSDNAAADQLWQFLGGGRPAAQATEAQLREAGDTTTTVEHRRLRPEFSPFGQTLWSVRDQAAFVAGMACTAAGPQVLGLMGQIDSGQRWGLGAAGVQAELKGGWGPGVDPGAGSGYFDRQMGVLTVAGKPMAVAIAAAPADGSHDAGAADLTAIARWIVRNADVSALPSKPRC